MAAKYRKIDPRIWHDEKFSKLPAEDKLLAIYCLTCSQANRIGIFHLSLSLAAEQTGYPCHTLAKGIPRVCHTLSWRFETSTGVMFFPSWWKYNGECGPKTMQGNMADLHDVPQSELIKEFASERRYLNDDEFSVLTRVCQGYAKGMPYPSTFGAQEQEQEQEQEESASPPTTKVSAEDFEIPANLDTPAFRTAWDEWKEYRRSKRKPISKHGATKQLKELSAFGESGAIEAIEQSIRNDYQGLFEPKSNGKKGKSNDSGTQYRFVEGQHFSDNGEDQKPPAA